MVKESGGGDGCLMWSGIKVSQWDLDLGNVILILGQGLGFKMNPIVYKIIRRWNVHFAKGYDFGQVVFGCSSRSVLCALDIHILFCSKELQNRTRMMNSSRKQLRRTRSNNEHANKYIHMPMSARSLLTTIVVEPALSCIHYG